MPSFFERNNINKKMDYIKLDFFVKKWYNIIVGNIKFTN